MERITISSSTSLCTRLPTQIRRSSLVQLHAEDLRWCIVYQHEMLGYKYKDIAECGCFYCVEKSQVISRRFGSRMEE